MLEFYRHLKEIADNLTAIEIEATEMADAELTCMDAKLYNAAFEGAINAFQQGIDHIEQLLTPNKNTVLHIHFTAETEKVSKDFVKYIINLCPSIVLQANAKRETPLHIAARYGHSAAVEILIEHSRNIHEDLESGVGADKKLIRATDIVGDSALHKAVRYNHIQVVKLLIKEDPDYPYVANDDGETPLYLAAERGYKDIMFEILENCKSAAYGGPDGRTALHAAVTNGDEEMVKGLLVKEHLNSSIKEADKRGRLPLHVAVLRHDYNLTKLLLEHNRKAAYMRDNEGRTALHLAARFNNIMEMILSHCPDSAEIVDNNGQNALHYAVSGFQGFSKVQLILEKLSLSNLYNEKDVDGNTPLHLSSSFKYLPSPAPTLIEHPRVDKLAFNKENCTAYDIASNRLSIRTTYTQYSKSEFKDLLKIENSLREYGARMEYHRIKTPTTKKDDDDCNKDSGDINKNDEDEDPFFIKRAKESHLVVAALIATVTFAAGLTLPGGTIQEGNHQGTAILKHNSSFQAFIVTDTVAMVLSATAVLIHLVLALTKFQSTRVNFLAAAFLLTGIAMASMMIAFVTGTYAMLGVSSGLGVAILLIGLSFFILVISIRMIAIFQGLKYNQKTHDSLNV